ncbi:MAG: hypothetical protein IJ067_01175 [Prevotella sp.]|nr:hypothetical protein [Prevotella sp.]
MITQLLKLDPPYNIICGRNKIAKHVATFIVADIKYDKEYRLVEIGGKDYPVGGPDMKTYSFPVVEYGDGSPAGDVWNDVEVRECRVIAKAPKDDGSPTRIWSSWFCETLRFLHNDEYGATQTPLTLYEQLKSLHVDVDKMGTFGDPKRVEVELEFNDSEDVSSIDSATGSELFFTAAYATGNERQKEEKLSLVLRWAAQYIRILNVLIVFTTKAEPYQEMLAEWNEALEKAAKQYNERK